MVTQERVRDEDDLVGQADQVFEGDVSPEEERLVALGAGEEPEAQPVAEVPAPAFATPPATAPVPAPLTDPAVIQRQLAEAQRQLAWMQEKERQGQVTEFARQEEQRLIQQGLMPEQAQMVVGRLRQAAEAAQQASMRARQETEHLQGKMNAAFFYAQQYGVTDPRVLMTFDTPQAMEAHAQQLRSINQMQAELAALKKATVPPQAIAGGPSAPAANMSQDRLLDSANSKPSSQWTEAERAAVRQAAGA